MRKICWFSCGAPSAVAAKLVLAQGPTSVLYCEIAEEHSDNKRFRLDVQTWLGQEIRVVGNDTYARSIYEVFRRERYLVGIQGAPCTRHLKRKVRETIQEYGDIHILGYTVEEEDRVADFRKAFPSLLVETPLIERGLTKADCLAMIDHAGIELPMMYKLGYNNNNCVGCVKGGMGYWNKIRVDFPERFAQMAKTEREIGHSINRQDGLPVYLDELDPDAGRDVPQPLIDCSIMCLLAKQEYSG